MLAQRLKELREAKDLSQKELGEILKISNKTISDYERNISTPDIDTLKNMCEFFGVTIDYAVSDSKELEEQTIELYCQNLALRIRNANLDKTAKKQLINVIEGSVQGYLKK